jgi:hypothetical protein
MDTVQQNLIRINNKLIADFMGIDFIVRDGFDKNGESFLKYHTSWNSLMPVVEKIMAITDMEGVRKDRLDFEKSLIAKYHIGTDIDTVWAAVVNFIQWYTQNKNQ